MSEAVDPNIRTRTLRISRREAVRWLSHVTIWVVVLAPCALEMSRGWRAFQDNATISLRSYQVLSLHPPLLGQLSGSSIGSGHSLFDPGPLQYWLLALPVHIDPAQGALWGSAVLFGLVLSLAVEALWRTDRVIACGVFALVVLDLAWMVPGMFSDPAWNPYFAVPFLLTSMVLAWVVATGSLGWWPLLVFTGSVAVQAEAFFVYFFVSLVIVSPIIGLLRHRPERHGWWKWGSGVALLLWLPTILQEITSSPGNLTLLVTARRAAPEGVSFGLEMLGFAGSLPPVWATASPYQYSPLSGGSSVVGAAVLVVLAVVGGVAWRAGRLDLATLSLIGFICAACTVVTFSSIPQNLVARVSYLDRITWCVGMLAWIVLVWGSVELGKAVWSRRLSAGWRPARTGSPVLSTAVVAVGIAMTAAIAWIGIVRVVDNASNQVDTTQLHLLRRVARETQLSVPKGPVLIQFNYGKLSWFSTYSLGQGLAWQLTSEGWRPMFSSGFTKVSGIAYPHVAEYPAVNVLVKKGKATVYRTR